MIDIPANVRIRATIRPGAVFYYDEDTYVGDGSHYFVVLNVDPTATDDIVLLGATSQITSAKRRTQQYPGTLVILTPADYPDFTEPESAFNGNEARVVTVGTLVSKLDRGALRLHSNMDVDLVTLLRAAVLVSPVIERTVKKLISARG